MRQVISLVAMWSVAAALLPVNAWSADAANPSKLSSTIVKALLKDGKDRHFPEELGGAIGIGGVPLKQVPDAKAPETPDGMRRACAAIMERNEKGQLKPKSLIISFTKSEENSTEKLTFLRFRLDGSVEAASLFTCQVDADGRGVVGSGVTTDLDKSSPEVQAWAKRELAFWVERLTKKGSKKPAKQSAGGPTPQRDNTTASAR